MSGSESSEQAYRQGAHDSYLASAGLAGACAISGDPDVRFSEVSSKPITDIDPNTGRVFQLTVDPQKLARAAELEQSIWYEEGYGSLSEYAENITNSRTFTAFDENRCVGVARLFEGTKRLPPFVSEMPFYDKNEQSQISESCRSGETEELGTIAVDKQFRNGLIFENLARLSYRDAFYGRHMKYWGIIMEPERVKRMNRHYGFTFKQLGPTVDYQGGLCAAHIMDLQEVNDNMSEKFPEIYNWFVNEPLKT